MPFPFQPTALAAGISALCIFSSQISVAADSIAQPKLDTIVVTATRSQEKLENVPARISIIDESLIDQSPIASFPHLLMSDASINMVQLGGYGQQASFFLRGTESDHTLVLRDGVRLNNDASGLAPNNFIDTTDIKQIEVLKGPASVLYGTNAIGGVVQIISKTPEKNAAFISAEIGGNQTYKSTVGVDLAKQGFYAQIRGQRLETDGTLIHEHENARASSFNQKGVSAKFGYEETRFGTSLDYSENQGNAQYEQYSWNSLQYEQKSQDFKNQIATLKSRFNPTDQLTLNARVSYFKDELEQLKIFEQTHYESTEYELTAKQQMTPSQNIIAGITHRQLETSTLKTAESFHQDLNSTGYYLQHQYQTDKLKTQAGIRREDHEKYGQHTVGQVAARYFFTPLFSSYANIGTAFKAPTMNDLYYGDYANPDLKPEESQSYEIGLDLQMTPQLKTGLSIYRTEIDNLIDSDPNNNWKFANIDAVTIQGSEVYVNWSNEAFFTKASYSYNQAKNDKTGLDLSRRPRQKLALSAGWADEHYGLSTTLSANSHSDSSNYDEDVIPGHAQIDFNSYYQPNEQLRFFANIQNVGDVQYKTASAGNFDGKFYLNGGRLASFGITVRY